MSYYTKMHIASTIFTHDGKKTVVAVEEINILIETLIKFFHGSAHYFQWEHPRILCHYMKNS